MYKWDSFPQGTVLIRLVVDKEGKVQETEILNAYNQKLESAVYIFLKRSLSSLTFRMAKHKDEKVNGEIVVPLYIGVRGYGPVPSANNSMWMMQQQQMHMMQMQNNFRPPMGF